MCPVIASMLAIDPALLHTLKQTVDRVFESAIGSVAVTDASALVDVSALREEISRSFNKSLSERVQSINRRMSRILQLPEDIFIHILDIGAFSLDERVTIARVCTRWLQVSREHKAAVTISKPLHDLTLSEIDDVDFGLRHLLESPPIVHLAFCTAEFSRPREFSKLMLFLDRHLETARTVDCVITWRAPHGCDLSALARILEQPAPDLTRLDIEFIAFPEQIFSFEWFNHHAPKLTTVAFKRVAFFCPAFANVRTVVFKFTTKYNVCEEDMNAIFTQFPHLVKLIFEGTMADESAVTAALKAPSTLQALQLVDRTDTTFLDLVDHSAVPVLEVDFSRGYHGHCLTTATVQRLRAEPPVMLHLHFRRYLASVKLVDSHGHVRSYTRMSVEECLSLPLFSRVKSLAITGLRDVSDRHGTLFPVMPQLEDLCLVMEELRIPRRMTLPCPRLERVEFLFRPEQGPIDPPPTAANITEFYNRVISAPPSSIELRLPGLVIEQNSRTQLAQEFAALHNGLSVHPYILPKCT